MTDERPTIEQFVEKLKKIKSTWSANYIEADTPTSSDITIDGWWTIEDFERVVREVYCPETIQEDDHG